jgi:molybdate transport system substrate-binding protein
MTRIAALLLLAALFLPSAVHAADLRIAAAADLKFAMDEIVEGFRGAHPEARIETVYGSSGKFHTQIRQGAPFDVYFSADIEYPRLLAADGHAAGPVVPYAVGRLVLWSGRIDATQLSLAHLADPAIRRVAIANPRHAPYGQRAEEALRSAGVWEAVQRKLVFGENIAQTAQFVQTGNADVGLIALSLALHPELAGRGGHLLIDDALHAPLEQGFVVTRRAAGNALAAEFATFVIAPEAHAILDRYGFELPAP